VNDLAFDDPCLLFALRREAQPFFREFRPQQRFTGAPIWARFCGPSWLTVLVGITGMGQPQMERTVQWVLSKPRLGNVPYRPKVVLSAGISGGLDVHHASGDIILATEVVDSDGSAWPVTWPGKLPDGEWRPPLHRGRILSVSSLVCSSAEKQRLGAQHSALAVDMETAAVARLCTAHGVAFGCIRAIADDARTCLPAQLPAIFPDGRISLSRLVPALIRSPRLVQDLFRLDRACRHATRQLSAALGELLTLTLPWAGEL
jgi:adenosylhomocysteine nucleosidase